MSETAKRILAGLALGAFAVGALYFEVFNWVLPLVLILVFSLMGLYEFFHLTDRGLDGAPFRKLGFLFAILIILGFYAHFLTIKARFGFEPDAGYAAFMHWFYPGESLAILLLVFCFIACSAAQLMTRPLDGAIYSILVTIGGIVYTTLTLGHGLLILAFPRGIFYLIFFVLLPILMDSGAYFAGRWFGRHNAGLKVSPRKTYEGYVGGIIFTIVVANAVVWGWKEWANPGVREITFGHLEVSLVAFGMAILSIFGDLAESAFKRDANIKDSASTIPGHGGMLDLADAIYFCLPVAFYYMLVREMLGFGF